LEKTRNAYYGPDADVSNGPKTVLYDLLRSLRWELLTHGGFLTCSHHDAEGQVTWNTTWSGAKLWIIIQPKNTDDDPQMIEEFYTLLDKLLPDLDAIPNRFEVFTVLIEPGQVM